MTGGPRVAFVGLGAMGGRMAANLLEAGFPLTVHNRTRSKEEPLAEKGASRAATPGEAARASDVVVTMVEDTPDVEEVLFGPAGVASAAAPGTLVIDMSTIDPESTRTYAGRLAERDIRMIDAPVSGGTEGAETGTLSIMVGGGESDVAAAGPVLEALGDRITHIGPSGSGQVSKAINQVIVAGTFLAVAEGVALGQRGGVDMHKVLRAVGAGAAGSWALEHRAVRMISGEFPLGFKVRLHRKDLAIALAAAERWGAALPGARLVAEMEDWLIESGLGDADVSALVRAVLDRNQ